MKSYSFEIYEPETDGCSGHRIACEDHYISRKEATNAMKQELRNAPIGSTAIVYPRCPDNGDILTPVYSFKMELVIRSTNQI